MKFCLFSLLILLPAAAPAGFYSYRDENGTLHAVTSPDEIPEEYRAVSKKLFDERKGGGEGKFHLERVGNSLLIEVDFGTGEKVPMVLDTGASVTMISHSLAGKIKGKIIGGTQIATASNLVNAPIMEVPKVAVGGYFVRDLKVAVHNMPGGLKAEGLLGVDFLNNFRMRLDTEAGELHLERK